MLGGYCQSWHPGDRETRMIATVSRVREPISPLVQILRTPFEGDDTRDAPSLRIPHQLEALLALSEWTPLEVFVSLI